MSEESDPRLYHVHVARNREPILDVARDRMGGADLSLEWPAEPGAACNTVRSGIGAGRCELGFRSWGEIC
jgi:hypothetical protein